MINKKAVIIFSGGLDSTTCLALANHQGFDCYTLTFDYNQRHRSEFLAAERIAAAYKINEHRVFKLDLGQFGGSALTDQTIKVEDFSGSQTIPNTYVPARNTIFFSIALAYAEVIGANDIFIGVSAIDYSGYPDCRPEYIAAVQNMANLATKNAIEGNKLTIHTPLIHLTKAQTILLGLQHQVDYSLTVSCYRADDQGRACGRCDSCVLRRNGFQQANQPDPTRYIDE
ncbi:MAG: 7-cyano-7-deazaguanine synthase QueC [Legionellales bacterium]|nr:7-cyano-7-deazaguanine synthase QueC [Legionellales bacterium]